MQATNLRELLGVNASYATFNREERNYAALLYHFLMSSDEALKAFLTLFGQPVSDPLNGIEIYVEYAHARDLWFKARKPEAPRATNECYLRTIVALLGHCTEVDVARLLARKLPVESGPSSIEAMVDRLDDRDFILEFNKLFDGSPKPSDKWIQMPGRWGKSMLKELRNEHLALCERAFELKWAFNAKADMVIHTGHNSALCVEMKFESPESNYTAHWLDTPDGRKDPKNRYVMGQLRLQQIILQGLLGYTTNFALVSKFGPPTDDTSMQDRKNKRRRTGDPGQSQCDQTIKIEHQSWRHVFDALIAADSSLVKDSRKGFVSALMTMVMGD